jgi:ABC-type uncharacterized transport system permease subunit
MVVIAVAVGIGMFFAALRLPKQEQQAKHKALFSVVGWVVGILLLVDIVFVVEGVAHLIWPNFVDSGT